MGANLLPSDADVSNWPGARRAVKLPVDVPVRFARTDGVCATLEGPVAYAAGDAILTGVRGETWPVTRARFDASYEARTGTAHGADGVYRKRPAPVWALCLQAPTDVALAHGHGVLHGDAGDWLVQYGPGDFGVVGAAIFAATYRLE